MSGIGFVTLTTLLGATGIMRIAILFVMAISLTASQLLAAEAPAKESPQLKARIVCFNGKVDSGSSCSTTNFQADGTLHATGNMTCGFPGRVSALQWSFVERRGAGDVYRFTRRFPVDTAAVSSTEKTVEFRDGRVIVFEDEFQVVVIETPKK